MLLSPLSPALLLLLRHDDDDDSDDYGDRNMTSSNGESHISLFLCLGIRLLNPCCISSRFHVNNVTYQWFCECFVLQDDAKSTSSAVALLANVLSDKKFLSET